MYINLDDLTIAVPQSKDHNRSKIIIETDVVNISLFIHYNFVHVRKRLTSTKRKAQPKEIPTATNASAMPAPYETIQQREKKTR